jgi:cellobiose phosphorylase
MGRLKNEYGYFSEDGREYHITNPATPMPWVNVISNGDYGLVISQAGSGYSWRTHASLNRLTRWDQDLIRDEWGKYLYLRDRDTGEFWSPTWQPCGAGQDRYLARHGWGYSTIEAARGEIESQVTYFVPHADPCEIWHLQLVNRGQSSRRLQMFTYLEWLLGVGPDWHREFHQIFIQTRYSAEAGVLLANKVLWELPGATGPHWNRSWPYVAFHSASLTPAGFDGYKRAFLGRHGSPTNPQAVREGRSQSTQGRWADAIGSLQVNLELPPGEPLEVAFTLGAAEDEDQALELAERYQHLPTVHQALEEVQRFWRGIAADLVVETPDPAVNLLANGWLQYQAISARLWGRTAYYQLAGAYGFRDQLQDSLVWLLLGRPEETLAQIRLHAAHQYHEGIVLHWWHPLAETGLRSEYSDDLLWLPFVVLYYLNETGDFSCLQEQIPFYDQGAASLLEHCRRAFEVALARRSARGLPLILKGDWNDGLNAAGAEWRGESVWMAHFLYFLLTRWSELPALDEETQTHFRDEAQEIRHAANDHAWDGAWYWRATTDAGELLGSARNEQGRIFLNAQTWAAISGLAPKERAALAMKAARTHLYQPYGPLLLAPAYHTPDPSIGYLTRYAPGARENGGVYVHAACWAVLAERQVHDAQSAYQVWRSFCPAVRGAEPGVYLAEPYVMPGNVDGPESDYTSRGGWTWYTGSAQWYLRALLEGVLGIAARRDGLQLQAGLPDGWDGYRVVRKFRGALYDIQVRRVTGKEEIEYLLDGQPLESDVLPIPEPGAEHVVEINIPD